MLVYHGGYCAVENPELRVSKNPRDFGNGFYCTQLQTQADRWAKRYDTPAVSIYEYTPSETIDILKFDSMTDEWLEFIVACRSGKPHRYSIVDGAMANDQIWNYISDYISGMLTHEQFWVLAKFKYPTHQIAFCSEEAIGCLKYLECYEVGI
jgi:hypothetical protein